MLIFSDEIIPRHTKHRLAARRLRSTGLGPDTETFASYLSCLQIQIFETSFDFRKN